MMIDPSILEQILREEILVSNEYDIGALVTFRDSDGVFKDFFVQRRITSNNALNAMKVLSEELEEMNRSLLPQEVEHVIIGATPYIEGVS
jgi:hypothetical protein